MRAVIQRIENASVELTSSTRLGAIDRGLLVYLGVESGDAEKDVTYIVDKILHMRIFEDSQDKMNLSVLDVHSATKPYGVLLISQFTLLGDCRTGRRPSFSDAAPPDVAMPLYREVIERLKKTPLTIQEGQFQAMMRVVSTNCGPVTVILDSHKKF